MHKIESIEVYRVAMPLVYPFRTAYGNTYTIESIFVNLNAGDYYGWGESTPWRLPAYSPESAACVFLTIRDFLAPLVLHKQITSGADLQKLLSTIKGNYFAKAALDLAWWDIYAKTSKQPLWKIIGGKSNIIEVGADFGVMENIDALLHEIDNAVKAGFKRVKLKYRPGWDLEMVATVRNAFPEMVFHIDCNSYYTLNDIKMFKQLDQYNLAMIEQPLMHDDLIYHAELQKQISTPICLDESITSIDKVLKAIQIKACRVINIKPGRVGGLTNAIQIHEICRRENIPCWIGGMLESSLGASFCAALATLPNIQYPSDIFPSKRFYKNDLSRPEMVLSGPSQIKITMQSGVGAEPDPYLLEKMNIEHIVICN